MSAQKNAPQKALYVTATSHLDTQWRWTFQNTITQYLPRTLHGNFALFEKFPNYVFSFEGAYRYMLFKEYFPAEYEELKGWIDKGRWALSGAVVDTGDVNTVSPESLIRHMLYGNGFFRREFGKVSRDILFPDCFGFGWALPSLAAHCGVKSFSTSKLEWGSSNGIPFDVGFWGGVDGKGVLALINPGQYAFPLKERIDNDEKWLARIDTTGDASGVYFGYKYFGLGDTGGAPDENSVQLLEDSIAAGGPYQVVSASADAPAELFTDEQLAKLPRHASEFLLIEHGTGTYTSNGAMKRWNRKNELLGDEAERAAVIAEWLGGASYPREKLAQAWVRFIANQMHDILPGTCIPEAYQFSWNDEVVSLNQFAEVLTNSAGAAARALDTNVEGTPLVVYNSLAFEREDLVEASLTFAGKPPAALVAVDSEGKKIPVQVIERDGNTLRFVFCAVVPALGYAVFSIERARKEKKNRGLKITGNQIENERYRVSLNSNGDIFSLYDKQAEKELLAAPMEMQLLRTAPAEWPAWTIIYRDVSAPPRGSVGAPAEIRVVEEGPVRVALEITREAEGSRFVQRVSLAAGAAHVELGNAVRWETRGTMLKAAFPLTVANEKATYDLGLGVIERGNNREKLHEVPAQHWADLTDADGSYGVTLFSDSKYGWDKPADNTLRHTLVHTPEMTGFHCHLGGAEFMDHFCEQAELDFGHHNFTYCIAGHEGDWREGAAQRTAARFNHPLLAFETAPHKGKLGRVFSFAKVNSDAVVVNAVKKAEESDEVVVRVFEAFGAAQKNVELELGRGITQARELNGAEEPIGKATVRDGKLVFALERFQPRTFAVKLAPAPVMLDVPKCAPLPLLFNCDGISENADRTDGNFDGRGHSLPAELLRDEIVAEDILFQIGPRNYRETNVLIAQGQTLKLPRGKWDRLYLLAASIDGDIDIELSAGEQSIPLHVQCYSGRIGSWDDRVINGHYVMTVDEMRRGFIKRAPIAWLGTHRHSKASNADEAYVYCYLYKLEVVLPEGARQVTLPKDSRLRALAATAAKNPNADTRPAGMLYD